MTFKAIPALAVAALCAGGARADAPVPPRTDARLVAKAVQEGKVVVYATTDAQVASPLLADFAGLHPGIAVEYRDLMSGEIYDRVVAEVARGVPTADVVWSSSMDLQMKLANDGLAAAYHSPEADRLPSWAVWNDEAYGTTFEPVAFVYNERLLAPEEVPRSHADLARLLRARPERFAGRIATYDPERSGIGFLLLTQDERIDPAFEDHARAYGAAGLRLYTSTEAMLRRVRSGEHLLAFNVLSSYALARPREGVRIVYPRDYTLVLSRVVLVPKAAPHPSAARVFLDYLLSKRAQEIIANDIRLGAVRMDVSGAATAVALSSTLGPSLAPISMGTSLLVYLDASTKREFLLRWRRALGER